MKSSCEELREEIWAILYPEPDECGDSFSVLPHTRLGEQFGLDTSYFQPPWSMEGDRRYDHLVEDPQDSVHKIIESTSVPRALLDASLRLFAESIITYCSADRTWGVYRYFPSILMTVWSAFESWVRITSELFINVASGLPPVVADALMEVRPTVKPNGEIGETQERRSTLMRYWLFLKYACNIEYDRGSRIWQNGEAVVKARDELVHYHTSKAPTLTMRQVWDHMEAVLLLFIGPSIAARRTLLHHQYEYHWALVELQKFISDFEERPLHKGWPPGPSILYCPFDNVDETKYRRYHESPRE